MWKVIGSVLLLVGAAGVLYSWVLEQREKEKRLEVFLHFLQKSLAFMQTEKLRVVDYFSRYGEIYLRSEREAVLERDLGEISKRLASNTYPNGQMVWEEVFQGEDWGFDREIASIIVQAGNGFFGRSRGENISFLEKSIKDLDKYDVLQGFPLCYTECIFPYYTPA